MDYLDTFTTETTSGSLTGSQKRNTRFVSESARKTKYMKLMRDPTVTLTVFYSDDMNGAGCIQVVTKTRINCVYLTQEGVDQVKKIIDPSRIQGKGTTVNAPG